MSKDAAPARSARRDELLERAYAYALAEGIGGMSLRPLATAIGSSPRVLLFLFGSKDELVRALLARARAEELGLVDALRELPGRADLATVAETVWDWLVAPDHRGLLRLWAEGYTRALVEPNGAWQGFATDTVHDWLDLLALAQPAARRRTAAGVAERTLTLAVLRGALLDLLATNDDKRATAAVRSHVDGLRG